MKIDIIGAGSIGGTLGAHLVRKGHDVRLIDNNQRHVEAINEHGLVINGGVDLKVEVAAFSPDVFDGSFEVVLLCVKGLHTEDALAFIGPRLSSDGYVVSLQNGFEEYKIARVVGEGRTVGAFVDLGADYISPGVIAYGNPGAFFLGELDGRRSERTEDLRAALDGLMPVRTTDNIFGYLWAKASYASILFAVSTVDADREEVLRPANAQWMVTELVGEVVAVARAVGIQLEPFGGFEPAAFTPGDARSPEGVRRSLDWMLFDEWRNSLKKRSGIWRDLAVHRRPTEVDHQVGEVVRMADEHGVPVPLNRRLLTIIKEIEREERGMDWSNLDELVSFAQERYGRA